jgi:hypothetical protein
MLEQAVYAGRNHAFSLAVASILSATLDSDRDGNTRRVERGAISVTR